MDKDYFMDSAIPPPLQLDHNHAMATWNSLSSAQELNCSSEQQPMDCFMSNSCWDNRSTDQFNHFDSALSSMVSSPAATSSPPSNDGFVLRELIGKLGSINNSNELRQQFQAMGPAGGSPYMGNSSTGVSCFSTPLSSPSKLIMPMMDQIGGNNLPNSRNSVPLSPALPSLSADPGFAERAAKFSCFGSRSFNGRTSQLGVSNSELTYRSGASLGQLHRVLSNPSIKQAGSPAENENSGQPQVESGPNTGLTSGFDKNLNRLSGSGANSNEESSVSEQVPSGEAGSKTPGEMNSRKRKAVSRGKSKADSPNHVANAPKVAEADENVNAKRSKTAEGGGQGGKKEEEGKATKANSEEKGNQKPPEPPKDYIHVRARRGQATDSHSLAERVRREKISERMKLLQDLVPGCNKVTGKALMLDEIINYVQALQRQVEFLSMKLASVNPRMDFEGDSLTSKDNFQPNPSLPQTMYQLDSSAAAAFYGHQNQQTPQLHSNNSSSVSVSQCPVDPLDSSTLCRSLGMQLPPLDGFGEGLQQFSALCEDDLHSLVQMGFHQNPNGESAFHSQGFPAQNQASHMKIEL